METASYWLLFLSAAFAIDIAPDIDVTHDMFFLTARKPKVAGSICKGGVVNMLLRAKPRLPVNGAGSEPQTRWDWKILLCV
jgi:hypothetical protein